MSATAGQSVFSGRDLRHGAGGYGSGARAVATAATLSLAAAVAILSFVPAVAHAQAAGSDPYGSAFASGYSRSKRSFDIIYGQNKTGPYPLSYTALPPASLDSPMVVNVDGKALSADAYTVDRVHGTITFTTSLATSSMARIEYAYDPVFSQPNPNATASAAPLTLGLTKFAGVGLQLSAVSSAGGNTQLVWGMGGTTKVFGGGLTSQLMFGDAANGKTDFMDRTGMKLGYALGNKDNGLDFGLTRAGAAFAPSAGKTIGLTDARQNLNFGARLKPMNWLGTSYTLSDSRGLAGQGTGTVGTYGLHLGGLKPTGPVLNFQTVKNDTTDAAKNRKYIQSNNADFTSSLAPTLGLAAKTAFTQTDATDNTQDATVQESSLSLTSKNKAGNVNQMTLSLVDGMTKNVNLEEKHQRLALGLQTTKTLGFSFNRSDTMNDPAGANNTVTAQESSFSLTSKNAKGNVNQMTFSLVDGGSNTAGALEDHRRLALGLQATKTFSLAVNRNDSQADPLGADNTTTSQETSVNLASKNAKGNVTQAAVALVDGLVKAPDSTQTHQGVSVTVQAAPKVAVTVGKDERLVDPTENSATPKTDNDQTTVGATITPAPAVKVTTSLQQGSLNDKNTQATSIDAQFNVGKKVAVTGGITNRDSDFGGTSGLDSTRVTLAVTTAPGISLTTGLVMNPTDTSTGGVNQGQQQNVGLSVKHGSWNFGTGYSVTMMQGLSLTDPRGLPLQSGEMTFTLGLKLSPVSQLTWNYKNTFLYGTTNPAIAIPPRGLEAYSWSFTQNLGERFNLSFGGSVTDNPANLALPHSVAASAKVGMKF